MLDIRHTLGLMFRGTYLSITTILSRKFGNQSSLDSFHLSYTGFSGKVAGIIRYELINVKLVLETEKPSLVQTFTTITNDEIFSTLFMYFCTFVKSSEQGYFTKWFHAGCEKRLPP